MASVFRYEVYGITHDYMLVLIFKTFSGRRATEVAEEKRECIRKCESLYWDVKVINPIVNW